MTKFHFGPPQVPSHLPAISESSHEWVKLKEPTPAQFQWQAMLVAAAVMISLSAAVFAYWGKWPPIAPRSWFDLPGVIALMLIHEAIHLALHPGYGLSSLSSLGIWPARGVAYAQYQGEMSCARFVAILVAPIVLLSVVPVALSATGVLPHNHWAVRYAIWNGLFASGDVLGTWLLLSQLPLARTVRNVGFDTWARRQ